jgi:RNA polymerase sigma factor (sigma-70 family)
MKLSGSELSLILAKFGHDAAVDALYDGYSAHVVSTIKRVLRRISCRDPRGHFEDVAQDTWGDVTAALQKPDEQREDIENPLAWLATVAIHRCYKHLREDIKGSQQQGYESDEEFDHALLTRTGLYTSSKGNQVERDYDRTEARRLLAACIDQLPRVQKTVIFLRREGLSDAEIGKILSMKENAVRKNVSRAMRRLEIEGGKIVGGKEND